MKGPLTLRIVAGCALMLSGVADVPAPLVKGAAPASGATAYVCHGATCLPPMRVVDEVLAALVAAPAYAALDNAQAEAMMKKDGCAACHSIDKKIVGPAYVEVATKYKGDKNAQATLEKKVKDGGVGNWGQIPMPPNAQVPANDIKELVTWILALKK